MKYRKFAGTSVEVSEISFGCWTLGGLNWVNGTPNGWANVDEDEVLAGVKAGIDAGVNHFDNADVYGNGRAERLLGKVLHRLGVRSTDFVIATKVGHFPGTAEHAYEPAHIRSQLEQSLINLRRDYVDIFYFHHADFGPDDRYLPEAAATMDALVKEGKVRLKGQSAYSVDEFERTIPIVKPQLIQTWANILDDRYIRNGGRMDNLMKKENLSAVIFAPLAKGLLLDKYDASKPPSFDEGDTRRGRAEFQTESLKRLKPKLEKMKARFGSSTEELAAVAMNYILVNPHVACVIPGFRNEKQARCNLAPSTKDLTAADLDFIREIFAEDQKQD
ncbi:MAG: aldo/keto reductase [Chthoniobacterales bacterium]